MKVKSLWLLPFNENDNDNNNNSKNNDEVVYLQNDNKFGMNASLTYSPQHCRILEYDSHSEAEYMKQTILTLLFNLCGRMHKDWEDTKGTVIIQTLKKLCCIVIFLSFKTDRPEQTAICYRYLYR